MGVLNWGLSSHCALINPTPHPGSITNATSRTRLAIKAYHQDFVTRFKASRAILFWELG